MFIDSAEEWNNMALLSSKLTMYQMNNAIIVFVTGFPQYTMSLSHSRVFAGSVIVVK